MLCVPVEENHIACKGTWCPMSPHLPLVSLDATQTLLGKSTTTRKELCVLPCLAEFLFFFFLGTRLCWLQLPRGALDKIFFLSSFQLLKR